MGILICLRLALANLQELISLDADKIPPALGKCWCLWCRVYVATPNKNKSEAGLKIITFMSLEERRSRKR